MEKREISILIVLIFGIFIMGAYGKITGNVINESIRECNIADFNLDGVVNYVDKEDFGEAFSLSPINKEDCSVLDFNFDGEISILDANVYNMLYNENYGSNTGECVQRKLACEEPGPGLELKIEPKSDLVIEEQSELAEEKPGFFESVKKFFNNLF